MFWSLPVPAYRGPAFSLVHLSLGQAGVGAQGAVHWEGAEALLLDLLRGRGKPVVRLWEEGFLRIAF